MANTDRTADVAIVGAGIIGLAHAQEAARRGYRVVVFERHPRAVGASVRNFGMVRPIGSAPGRMHDIALRSREGWMEAARRAGFWHDPVGSMTVAYHDDEQAVLEEFAREAPQRGYDCTLLDAAGVMEHTRAVQPGGLRGGLWSPLDVIVDPREAVAALPQYLEAEHGVRFLFGTPVTAVELPHIQAGGQTWTADRVVVCCGAEFETLYPQVLAESGITRCKLQMMRTEPQPGGWRMGPMLMTGLSLRHRAAFAVCPTLPELRHRVGRDHPDLDRFGIDILISQNGLGELTIGDSHEYGLSPEPFDNPEIDRLILEQVEAFLAAPSLRIAQRWHGVYAKHFNMELMEFRPEPNVRIILGPSGAGMTTAFGLPHYTFAEWN